MPVLLNSEISPSQRENSRKRAQDYRRHLIINGYSGSFDGQKESIQKKHSAWIEKSNEYHGELSAFKEQEFSKEQEKEIRAYMSVVIETGWRDHSKRVRNENQSKVTITEFSDEQYVLHQKENEQFPSGIELVKPVDWYNKIVNYNHEKNYRAGLVKKGFLSSDGKRSFTLEEAKKRVKKVTAEKKKTKVKNLRKRLRESRLK